MIILGISAFYHDSAVCIIHDGQIIAAAQEERFTRVKHDSSFPNQAIKYCLEAANTSLSKVDHIVFYDKPLLKFERLLETHLYFCPTGLKSFLLSMPVWMKEKLFLKQLIRKELQKIEKNKILKKKKILFCEHHHSHAASAFYPSPFKEASILCLDGVGEWNTSTVWKANSNRLELDWEINFPHSLGLLYSAFTYACGFKVNSGEYKLMGLAPYGKPRFVDLIKEKLIDIKSDGTFRLNMEYFSFATSDTMVNKKFLDLFNIKVRNEDDPLEGIYKDLAKSIQVVIEDIVLLLAKTIHQEHGTKNLCLAGGVALNCVANGRLEREGPFENIWIQPAAGDAGGALGSAMSIWHEYLNNPKTNDTDIMSSSYLGPIFSNEDIKEYLDSIGANYQRADDKSLFETMAKLLDDQNVIGHYFGRMEYGPRALGHRSILADARSDQMQRVLNLKIKKRESFRPFAPICLKEYVTQAFEVKDSYQDPYMLKTTFAKEGHPATTHLDSSSRLQTVSKELHPRLHAILLSFYERTSSPILINTSFNVRGEPIVCSPKDAFECFMNTDMDYLVLGNFILRKNDQSPDLFITKEFSKD